MERTSDARALWRRRSPLIPVFYGHPLMKQSCEVKETGLGAEDPGWRAPMAVA